MAHIAESHCNNGGCVRPIYRGKECFRCWAGTKWTSIVQRLENKTGHCNAYVGIPLGFTREQLIKWVMDNPPPVDMQKPSIDRIVDSVGYVPGNIRWLEFRKNASKANKDAPDGHRICAKCRILKPLDGDNFPRNGARGIPFGNYCIPCNRQYQKEWSHAR